MPNHWLLKTEPETYSFDQLRKDRRTKWSGIRNYAARNFLRQMSEGDVALIYHTGDDKAVVGIAKIVKGAYPDLSDGEEGGDWSQVDVAPVEPLPAPVSLKTIKATGALKDIPLVTHSRLSVMPITSTHFQTLLKLSTKAAGESAKK